MEGRNGSITQIPILTMPNDGKEIRVNCLRSVVSLPDKENHSKRHVILMYLINHKTVIASLTSFL